MPSLTKRFADRIAPNSFGKEITHWDSKLTGFGLRVQPGGSASWVAMYRTREGRLRKLTIGKVGTLTPDEARKQARQKLAEAANGLDPASEKTAARRGMTVAELCDWYVKEAEGRVKASTLVMDRSRIKCHVKPLIGARPVASLTSDDIARMQAEIVAGKTAKGRKGRGGVTSGGRGAAARTVGMLGTILEFGRRRKILKENPARLVEKLPGGKQRRFLSLDEIAALGKAMRIAESKGESTTALSAVRLLLLTGLRRMEALALPWAWVDTKSQCIHFGDTKSGPQFRAIGKVTAMFLESLRPETDSAAEEQLQSWVFPADRGEGYYVGLPRVLDRICRKAKLKGVTIHVLRHSFAATAAGMGYSELTIAGLLGHSVSSVTARYAHVPDAALLAAADKIAERIAQTLDGS
jgi:integrase